MLHAEGFPCLTVKAWNGRLLVIFIDRCLEAKIKSERDSNQQPGVELLNASVGTRSICRWFDLVERSPRNLEQQVANEIFDCGMCFLASYLRLAVHSVIQNGRRWKFLAKLHSFAHICEDMQITLINCRTFHTSRDEDMMGLLKRLAVRVHKGPLFEYRILTRWLLRLASWDPQAWWGKVGKSPCGDAVWCVLISY